MKKLIPLNYVFEALTTVYIWEIQGVRNSVTSTCLRECENIYIFKARFTMAQKYGTAR